MRKEVYEDVEQQNFDGNFFSIVLWYFLASESSKPLSPEVAQSCELPLVTFYVAGTQSSPPQRSNATLPAAQQASLNTSVGPSETSLSQSPSSSQRRKKCVTFKLDPSDESSQEEEEPTLTHGSRPFDAQSGDSGEHRRFWDEFMEQFGYPRSHP